MYIREICFLCSIVIIHFLLLALSCTFHMNIEYDEGREQYVHIAPDLSFDVASREPSIQFFFYFFRL